MERVAALAYRGRGRMVNLPEPMEAIFLDIAVECKRDVL